MSVYELTDRQKLIWISQQLAPRSSFYSRVYSFVIDGPVDLARFVDAFARLIAANEALRTTLTFDAGTMPRQQIRDELQYELPVIDASRENDAEQWWRQWLNQRARDPFDLADRNFDSALIQLGAQRHCWYLRQHHLFMDVRSFQSLYAQLEEFYRRGPAFAPPPVTQYSSYLGEARRDEVARAYWRRMLAQPVPPLDLYGQRVAGASVLHSTESFRRRLSRQQLVDVGSFTRGIVPAHSSQAARFCFLTAALCGFLGRVGDNSTLEVAMPYHNRSRKYARAAGLFMEVFPLRVQVRETDTMGDLVRRIAAETRNVLRHRQSTVGNARHGQSVNLMVNYRFGHFPAFDGHPVTVELHRVEESEFPLQLGVEDYDGRSGLDLDVSISRNAVPDSLRRRIFRHFFHYLDAAIAQPDRKLADIALLDGDDLQQLMTWGRGETIRFEDWPLCLHELFEIQAARTPERTAVVAASGELSYRALEQRANQLARFLAGRGVGVGDIVGMRLQPGLDSITAILGIMKAGAAYLPLSPAEPPLRLKSMLAQTAPVAVLASSGTGADWPASGAPRYCSMKRRRRSGSSPPLIPAHR